MKRTASAPLKYDLVSDLNLSWPAVSKIFNFTLNSSTWHVFKTKSTLQVTLWFYTNLWSMYCLMKQVLPTSKLIRIYLHPPEVLFWSWGQNRDVYFTLSFIIIFTIIWASLSNHTDLVSYPTVCPAISDEFYMKWPQNSN